MAERNNWKLVIFLSAQLLTFHRLSTHHACIFSLNVSDFKRKDFYLKASTRFIIVWVLNNSAEFLSFVQKCVLVKYFIFFLIIPQISIVFKIFLCNKVELLHAFMSNCHIIFLGFQHDSMAIDRRKKILFYLFILSVDKNQPCIDHNCTFDPIF